MLAPYLLSLALLLAPGHDRARLEATARAIAAVTDDRAEAVTLLVIDFHETTLGGARRPFPVARFGLTAFFARTRKLSLAECAALARGLLRRDVPACGTLAAALGRYHSGRCNGLDRLARRELRTAARLLGVRDARRFGHAPHRAQVHAAAAVQ